MRFLALSLLLVGAEAFSPSVGFGAGVRGLSPKPLSPSAPQQFATPQLRSSPFAPQEQASPVTVLQAQKGIDFPALNGTGMRIGIVHTRWNKEIVGKLKDGCYSALKEQCDVKEDNIVEFEVPGSWELPLAARYMALTQKVDAIVTIGVLVKGETDHYDMIKDSVCEGIMSLGLQTGMPIVCGVLGVHSWEQAESRATGDNNHGVWWGLTAVEMATLTNTQKGKASPAGEEKKKIMF
mmetsp:Transcript_48733/g.76091  ORF Transcript_48733/g.76091 Transcript_48733/m.76091 type:complete len:237 (+) Transcript_48733:3-713(+)